MWLEGASTLLQIVRDIFLGSYNSGKAGNHLCAPLHSPWPKLCNSALIHTWPNPASFQDETFNTVRLKSSSTWANRLRDKFGHTSLLQQQYWQPAKTAESGDSPPAMRPGNNPGLTVLCKGRTFHFLSSLSTQHRRKTGFFFPSHLQKIGFASCKS